MVRIRVRVRVRLGLGLGLGLGPGLELGLGLECSPLTLDPRHGEELRCRGPLGCLGSK